MTGQIKESPSLRFCAGATMCNILDIERSSICKMGSAGLLVHIRVHTGARPRDVQTWNPKWRDLLQMIAAIAFNGIRIVLS